MGTPTIAECDRIITAPGQVLEIEKKEINGRVLKTWKNLPPTMRSFIIPCFQTYSKRPFISAPPHSFDGSICKREILTFGEVLEKSLELAGWMKGLGMGVGSRIAIGGSNSSGWVITFIATHLIGGIAVCLNAWLPRDTLIYCLSVSLPHLVLLDGDRAELLGSSASSLRAKGVGEMYYWSSGSDPSCKVGNVKPWFSGEKSSSQTIPDLLSGKGVEELGPESDAVIFFTSGTSGSPKAVLSTQRMALTNLYSGLVAPSRAALRAGLPIPPLPKPTDPQRTVLLSIPLFHVTGCLSWLMRAIFAGSKMVYMTRWDVTEAVRLIESEKVSVIGGVPAVVGAILQSPLLPRDRSFDTVFYGGAPPSKQLAAEVKSRWPKAGLVQGYGMTETNAYAASVAGQDHVNKPDSTGPPVPICDLRIVNPDTREDLPTGTTGLLLVRGPQVMKCYYGDEEATRKTVDSDGWLDTGDIGMIDQEGFLYIRDRLKDIIIRGGENIASADVENAFYSDSRVSEAIAIGVPCPQLGERVGAIISLRAGFEEISEDDLLERVKPRLAYPAWPAVILIHDGPLPRNVNGKVVKKDLKPILVDAWEIKRTSKSKL